MSVDFTLNGHPASMASRLETPLLWALRDEKNLVRVKFGCGAGLCGACTVIIDGQQTRSCLTRLADVAGKTVQTIEGLSCDVAKAVTDAWIKAQGWLLSAGFRDGRDRHHFCRSQTTPIMNAQKELVDCLRYNRKQG